MPDFEAYYEGYQLIPRDSWDETVTVSGDTPKSVLRAANEHVVKAHAAKRGSYPGRRLLEIRYNDQAVWINGKWQKRLTHTSRHLA